MSRPSLSWSGAGVAVALVLASGLGALAQAAFDPARRAEEYAYELELRDEETTALTEVLRWLGRERQAMAQKIRDGEITGRPALIAERQRIAEGLTARLAAALPPDKASAVVVDDLLPSGPPLSWVLELEARHTFKQGFEEGPGRLSTTRTGFSTRLLLPLGKGRLVFFRLGAHRTRYVMENAFELDPLSGDPLEIAWGGSISLGVQPSLTERISALVVGSARINVEDGAEAFDGLTGGGVVGGLYRFNEQVSLGVGVSIRTQLEDRAQIVPIPLVQLNLPVGETSEIRVGFPDGIRLVHRPIPSLELSAGLGFDGAFGTTDTRLDERGFAPGGVMRTRAVPLELRAQWTPVPRRLTIYGGVGLVVYQKLEIDDRSGRGLTDDRVDPALSLFLGARLSL
ncbi:MAG: hypothetical protein D6776_03180 [Planctomycetota bacterium]|nr:MAG: hypothetical protein D6776_03180 [Planctomycetota bacterium]